MKTVRELYELEECYNKDYYSFIKGGSSRQLETTIIIDEIIKNYKLNFNEADVSQILNDKLKVPFISENEKALYISMLIQKMIRMKEYLKNQGFTVLRKPSSKSVKVGTETIKAKYSFILKDKDGNIIVARIKNRKPELTYLGRKDTTSVKKSVELYCLEAIGKEYYPNQNVEGAIIYLTNKEDSKTFVDMKGFEKKKGYNIIRYSFDDIDEKSVLERVSKIKNNKCTKEDCNMCRFNILCNFTPRKVNKSSNIKGLLPTKTSSPTTKLTPSQKNFTLFDNGICRVLATAGSGKTTVIVNRVIELIKKGYEAKRMLLITFTNQGVVELSEKLKYWSTVKNVDSKNVKITTFNNFCQELIEKHYTKFGFTEAPTILDTVTDYKIILNILDKNAIIEEYDYINPLREIFNAKGAVLKAKEHLEAIAGLPYLDPEDVADITNLSIDSSKILLNIYNEYTAIKKAKNLISINEQMALGLNLLTIEETEALGYEHIVVDEAQDTNSVQLNIISKIIDNSYFKSLAFCGDDSQAIYSWRGANNKLLLELDDYYDDVFDIVLDQNFRSTKQICDLSNNINKLNDSKVDKHAFSTRNGKKPTLIQKSLNEIALDIKSMIDSGVSPKDIAFIARTKKELLAMETELKVINIDSLVYASELLIENNYFKSIYSLTNFLADNDSQLDFCNFYHSFYYDTYINTLNKKNSLKKAYEDYVHKVEVMDDSEKLTLFNEELKMFAEYNETVNSIKKIIDNNKFTTFSDLFKYLNDLVLYKSDISITKESEDENSVNLITAHSSKGKEFDVVFLNISEFSSNKKKEELEEERRLLFVGITRAKNILNITYQTYKNRWYDEIASSL